MCIKEFVSSNLSNILQRYRIETAEQTADGQFHISAKPVGTITVRTIENPEGKKVRIKKPAAHCEGYIDYREIENYLTTVGNPDGSISFEVWLDHSGEKPGWLYNFTHNTEDPLGVVFALKQDSKLIATVAFEDINAFKERLIQIARKKKINTQKWTAKTEGPEGKLGIYPINGLSMPLELFLDMCKIDIVAEENYLEDLPNKDNDIRYTRLNFLKAFAAGQLKD